MKRTREEHPALMELRSLIARVEDDDIRRDLTNWMGRVGRAECESLLDKDAHGSIPPEKLRDILGHQAKNRQVELGRFVVEGAGITEDFDIGYAIGRRTVLWVLR